MPWHVGSDDRGGLFHYSCGVVGEGEGLAAAAALLAVGGYCRRGEARVEEGG